MKKVLITGSSGFLGKSLLKAFERDEVTTIGRSGSNTIQSDLSSGIPVLNERFDLVVHAAGKAHIVPQTEEEKRTFHLINETGTENLLNALEKSGLPGGFVFISSVAVYGVDKGENITENAPLQGNTPYAISKINAESIITKWCEKFAVPLMVLRLPLIVGSKPPGNLGDMIRGIESGKYFSIGKANARKSMVLAEDVGNFIKDWKGQPGIYNLTDGYHPSFGELEANIATQLNKKKPRAIPLWIAKLLGLAGDMLPKFPVNSKKLGKITSTLTFSDQKARTEQNWKPHKVLERFTI